MLGDERREHRPRSPSPTSTREPRARTVTWWSISTSPGSRRRARAAMTRPMRPPCRRSFDNPAAYYVNVHNEAFPPGAIRGQLAAGTSPPEHGAAVHRGAGRAGGGSRARPAGGWPGGRPAPRATDRHPRLTEDGALPIAGGPAPSPGRPTTSPSGVQPASELPHQQIWHHGASEHPDDRSQQHLNAR